MPQAKKAKFVITGTVAGGHSIGDIVDLEVDEKGLPLSDLMRSRTKPYRGKVQSSSDDKPADTAVADAKVEADRIVKEANDAATQLIEDAKKEAERLVTEAGTKANQTIEDAVNQAAEIVKEAKKGK